MEMTPDSLIAILTLILGGGGGAFFTWRWQHKKAKADAVSAEALAVKELQDIYQQLIEDIKNDRDEQKQYITELKSDRQHLRSDRDELRKRQDALEENIRSLQRDVARNGRMVMAMRPFLCGKQGCADRIPVAISDTGEAKPTHENHEIEPINNDAI